MTAPKTQIFALTAETLAKPVVKKVTDLLLAKSLLKTVAATEGGEAALAKRIEAALVQKARRLTVFQRAIPRSLSELGKEKLLLQLTRFSKLYGAAGDFALKVVRGALKKGNPGFERILDRLPRTELIDLIEKERGKLLGATAKARGEAIKRMTNAINELSGVYHPDVVAEMRGRAARAVTAAKASPAFQKEFELLEEEPSFIFQLKAAGLEGSEKASRQFVDARAVLPVKRLSDGRTMFIKLGDVQIKSTNVGELAEQHISDQARDLRGLDFAFRNRHGGAIPHSAFIDPADAKLASKGLTNPIGVGQRMTFPDRNVKLQKAGLAPLFFKHDVPLDTSGDFARFIADALAPK